MVNTELIKIALRNIIEMNKEDVVNKLTFLITRNEGLSNWLFEKMPEVTEKTYSDVESYLKYNKPNEYDNDKFKEIKEVHIHFGYGLEPAYSCTILMDRYFKNENDYTGQLNQDGEHTILKEITLYESIYITDLNDYITNRKK